MELTFIFMENEIYGSTAQRILHFMIFGYQIQQ